MEPVELGAAEHVALVEVVSGMVQVTILSPVVTTALVLTRAEARAAALALVDASQLIGEDT